MTLWRWRATLPWRWPHPDGGGGSQTCVLFYFFVGWGGGGRRALASATRRVGRSLSYLVAALDAACQSLSAFLRHCPDPAVSAPYRVTLASVVDDVLAADRR